MTRQKNNFTFISSILISLLLFCPNDLTAQSKKKKVVEEPDTIPFFRGLAVSADLYGLCMKAFGDYGQYEAALRINLKDKYFPIVELGYGDCNHTDDATQINYVTHAPYGKIGIDFNIMKNKHDIYRLLLGLRYAYTNYKYDISAPTLTDPVWGNLAEYTQEGVECNYHWAEFVFGVDATIWKAFHIGWSVRYRNRLFYDAGELDNTWYVPGYGKSAKSNFGATFNLIFDI